jgi:hypothetical protein
VLEPFEGQSLEDHWLHSIHVFYVIQSVALGYNELSRWGIAALFRTSSNKQNFLSLRLKVFIFFPLFFLSKKSLECGRFTLQVRRAQGRNARAKQAKATPGKPGIWLLISSFPWLLLKPWRQRLCFPPWQVRLQFQLFQARRPTKLNARILLSGLPRRHWQACLSAVRSIGQLLGKDKHEQREQ